MYNSKYRLFSYGNEKNRIPVFIMIIQKNQKNLTEDKAS